MRVNHWLLGFALFSLVTAAAPLSADAAVIQIFDRGALGGDDVIDWAVLGPAGTTAPNPFPITSELGLVSADVSKPAGTFQVFYQSTGGWIGNFATGDAVLWSRGDPGPIALDFAAPVVGAGAQIQRDTLGVFTGVVSAYDSVGGLLGEFTLEGEVFANTGDNSAIFLGILSDAADIARIEFSLGEGLGFGINRADVVTASAPTTTTTTPTTTTTTMPPEPTGPIDIKPGDPNNQINPFSKGVIPVVIFGSATFDVTEVDLRSLVFGPAEASPAHKVGGHFGDVNYDGLTDLVTHYRALETGIAPGDTEACVRGQTFAGVPFEFCDFVITVGRN